MLAHADFLRCVTVTAAEHHWVASPKPGVEPALLDRLGFEQEQTSSLLRVAPASVFPVHGHLTRHAA